jgi:hypothetical protein
VVSRPGWARRLWSLLEPVHDVTYFAPDARRHAEQLGVGGFWPQYVVQRAAPLGAVGAEVATAAFHGFHHDRLAPTLPGAWNVTTPDRALEVRLAGAHAALIAIWGAELAASERVVRAADLAWRAAMAADCAGRVLGASNQALPRPSSAHLALWQAATTLREHRGDGHVAVLVAEGVGPLESHLVKVAAAESDAESLRLGRKFGVDAWRAGVEQLRARGLLDGAGELTVSGRELHERVEAATDAAAEQPWRDLGEADTAALADLLTAPASAVVEAGILPVPNPVGLPAKPT